MDHFHNILHGQTPPNQPSSFPYPKMKNQCGSPSTSHQVTTHTLRGNECYEKVMLDSRSDIQRKLLHHVLAVVFLLIMNRHSLKTILAVPEATAVSLF